MNLVTILLFLFQSPSPSPIPTPHVPERTPALFTLIYVGGFALIILLLLLSLIRNRRQTSTAGNSRRSAEGSQETARLDVDQSRSCARCAGCLFCFRSDCFLFTSTGPTTPQSKTKSFRT